MLDLIPELKREKDPEPISTTTPTDDQLGSMLQNKWTQWQYTRRLIEENWLQDLRAFNQQNEPNVDQLSKFHSHLYVGMTRTKCMSAYSRIVDLMFQSRDKHWGIEPTPIPESEANDPSAQSFMDDMTLRAEKMATEIADQMIDLHYEDNLKAAILEGCIIGTGVVKGVIPGVKKIEKWAFQSNEGIATWDLIKSEVPAPQISSPSIFNVFPDPYANRNEDMSGVFERHVLNRQQFTDLKNDPRFDSTKIDEILSHSVRGNHTPLYHETDRRTIAGITDATGQAAERYDLLEYWGQVDGRMLQSAGIDDVEEDETRWCNIWTCAGKTLLAKIMPMAKQRIPYNFFIYNKVPHQFWGVSPARMIKHSQAIANGSVRALLDGMAMASIPMAEVNVHMLQDGQDPRVMRPGQVWLKDSGDPSVQAVRFFQPQVPTNQLIQMTEMSKSFADDESSLPAYTYGDSSQEINKTAQGMSMQMNAAALPIKSVVKNLEDFCIRPLIESLFDWNMQWSDDESIKGDMQIQVLGTSALIAKETRAQQLMQFLNITANPLDMQYIDRKYLLEQIAKSMEIDVKKAIPDQMPEQPQQEKPQDSLLDQVKAELIKIQIEHERAKIDQTIANTSETNVKSQFAAIQAALQLIINRAAVQPADELLLSAGYKDHNGSPIASLPQPAQVNPTGIDQNTSPQFPPLPPDPAQIQPDQLQQIEEPPMLSPQAGIETSRIEARANGGPVNPNQPYLVGEQGPEIIVPTQPGRVLSSQESVRYPIEPVTAPIPTSIRGYHE